MNPTTTTATRHPRWQRLAWLPIPLLLMAMAVLWVADLRTSYESRALMVLLNVFFTWLACLCIGILTARGFLSSGQPGLLMFGCGAVVWGSTSLAAAVIVDRVNPTITVHNVGVLAAAFCHFAGLLWQERLARPARWLVLGYAGALMTAALIFWAATAGLTPLFFVQGQGGTLVRQAVLFLAAVLFAWVAWQMISRFRRQAGDFYFWYGWGLALTATGLTGVILLTVQGSILGWTNRLTQYLGCAYLLIAAWMAARETGGWKISLEAVEEAWRKGELLPALRHQPLPRLALRYGFALVAVAAGFGFWLAMKSWLRAPLPPFITFYPIVMVVALLAGFGPGLLTTVLSAGVVAYWMMPPAGHFSIDTPADRAALAMFGAMGLLMSAVAELYRRNREKAAAYDREMTLRETEARLRRFYDSPLLGVISWNMDGKITDANDKFLEMVGYSREDLAAGRIDWAQMTPPELRHLDEASGRELRARGVNKAPFEKEYIRRDGSRVPILVAGAMLDAAGFDGVAFVLDITERKQAEEAASRSRRVIEELVERSPFGTYVVDSQFRIATMNTASQEGAFRNVRPVIGRDFSEAMRILWPEPVAAEVIGRFRHTLETGEPYCSRDFVNPRRDAEIVEAYEWELHRMTLPDGQYGVTCYYYDSTKLREAEQARQASEDLHRQTLHALPAHIAVVDPRGRIISVNPAWDEFAAANEAGGSPGLAVGSNYLDVCRRAAAANDGDAAQAFAGIEAVLTGKLRQFTMEYPCHSPQQQRWFLLTVVPLGPNSSGGAVITHLNITERKQAEGDLERTRNMLAEAQRIAHLGSWEYIAETQTTVWSDEQKRIYGLDPAAPSPVYAEMLQRHIHSDDAAALDKAFGEALRVGSVFENENRIVRPDGSVRFIYNKAQPYFDESGKLVRYVGATLDITERKQAEEALRESEARFRQTLESIPGMVFTTRPDGYCDYQSQQWVEFTGVPMSEHLGDGWNKLLHPDDRPRAYAAWRSAVEGRAPYDLEYRVRRHDGEYGWFKVIGRPICDAEGRITRWFGTALNIQDLVVARSALAESEARYRLLVEQTVDGILVADAQGRYQDVNSAGAAMLGYTREELCRLSLADVLAEDELERLPGTVAAYAGGAVVRSEWRFRRKDGSFFPGEVMGRQLPDGRLLGILRDITERKQAEEALRESEDQLRTAADSILNLAWWANADGYITWYNRRWYEYTGTTPQQMEGWGWQSVHDPQALPEVMERWKAAIATGEPFEMTFPLRGADGRFRSFLTRAQPLKDPEGRVVQWFGTNTDVEELMRSEESLRESQERLQLSLREKEVLLKEIHHRVKNNLQVISSLVDLQADTLQDPALRTVFTEMRDRVRSMALVHEKLYQSESLARVELADYTRSLLSYLARANRTSEVTVALKLDLQPVSLPVQTAAPCGLILNELVANAFKHAFRGRARGEITTALRTGADGRVCLRVSDDGVGLPAGLDWRQSRSLGLRLIHLLAGQLNATVEVRTGEGTDFLITFSQSPPEAAEE